MQAIIGLALIAIGAIFLYDVIAGKSIDILSLISGQTDLVTNWQSKQGNNGTTGKNGGSTQVPDSSGGSSTPSAPIRTIIPVQGTGGPIAV